MFHIVVADSRSKRDGKYIERLGSYNPNNDPATVSLNFDSAVKWVGTGAEMSDTARSILSKEGVLLKNHLVGGVRKGALTEDQADAKFAAWQTEKSTKADSLNKSNDEAKVKAEKEALANETKIKEAREAAVAAKLLEAQAAVEAAEVEAAAPAEEAVTEEEAPTEEAAE
mgnify:FL=1